MENIVKTIRYKTLKLNVIKTTDNKFYTDPDGDYFDTIEEAITDGMDTMKSKWNGTYYPSAQEIHNMNMERLVS